jgi:hypothetical protein
MEVDLEEQMMQQALALSLQQDHGNNQNGS